MDQLSAAVRFDSLHDPGAIKARIDARLAELLCDGSGSQVGAAMQAGTVPAGKRVRPVLLVLAAQDLGHDSPALIDLGCAIEMVHAGSLIVDDMPCMDNAALRRGQPTIHRRFGEDVAILATVALLSRAFEVVASLDAVDATVRTRLVTCLAEAVGTQGLVHGQYQDLREGTHARSARAIATTNELKTGVLFGATLHMAGLIAGATELQQRNLHRFAIELGHCFQLLDDLTDGEPDTGKDPGKDAGKSTLVALLGPEATRNQLAGHLAQADARLTQVYGPGSQVSRYVRQLFSGALPSLGQDGLSGRLDEGSR